MDSIEIWDNEIYDQYPRKVGKRAALKAIRFARTRLHDGEFRSGNVYEWVDCQQFLLTKTKQYAASPAGNRETLTPHPATFYNQSRYLDAEIEWHRLSPSESKDFTRRSEANIGVWTPQ